METLKVLEKHSVCEEITARGEKLKKKQKDRCWLGMDKSKKFLLM